MSARRILGAVWMTLLLAGALATTPAAAQAEPGWYLDNVELARGAPALSVPATGKISILIVGLRKIKCQVEGTEEVWNPAAGAGEDSLARLKLSRCTIQHPLCPESRKAVEVLPLGLPWHSALFAETSGAGDALDGVKLEVRCKAGHTLHLLEGTLAGPVGTGDLELAGTLKEAEPHREAIVELAAHLKSKKGKITAH